MTNGSFVGIWWGRAVQWHLQNKYVMSIASQCSLLPCPAKACPRHISACDRAQRLCPQKDLGAVALSATRQNFLPTYLVECKIPSYMLRLPLQCIGKSMSLRTAPTNVITPSRKPPKAANRKCWGDGYDTGPVPLKDLEPNSRHRKVLIAIWDSQASLWHCAAWLLQAAHFH